MPSVEDLARQCKNENAKFAIGQPNDPDFCLELLRLAFGEGDADAWNAVYEIYAERIAAWSRFYDEAENCDTDDLVQESFLRMKESVERLGFGEFDHLADFLRYWKLCVRTLTRQKCPPPAVPLYPQVVKHTPVQTAELSTSIWTRITELFPDPADRLLIDLSWYQGLPPRKVVDYASENGPSKLATERAVKTAKERVKRTMQRDDVLYDLLVSFAEVREYA